MKVNQKEKWNWKVERDSRWREEITIESKSRERNYFKIKPLRLKMRDWKWNTVESEKPTTQRVKKASRNSNFTSIPHSHIFDYRKSSEKSSKPQTRKSSIFNLSREVESSKQKIIFMVKDFPKPMRWVEAWKSSKRHQSTRRT